VWSPNGTEAVETRTRCLSRGRRKKLIVTAICGESRGVSNHASGRRRAFPGREPEGETRPLASLLAASNLAGISLRAGPRAHRRYGVLLTGQYGFHSFLDHLAAMTVVAEEQAIRVGVGALLVRLAHCDVGAGTFS